MHVKILSWNIREFGKAGKTKTKRQIRARSAKVAKHIRSHDPDVFGLLEVESVDIPVLMQAHFPTYDFGFTEGQDSKDQNAKEILVGFRRNFFAQAAFSVKRGFRLFSPYLRPGALLSVRVEQDWYNVLFLHTDSGTEAKDFGNRYEMFQKAWNLRKSLDKKAKGRRENLIVIGDLNTMGLRYPRNIKAHQLVTGTQEIAALEGYARSNGMQLLLKSHDETWHSTSKRMRSDLDHVLASEHLKFKVVGHRNGKNCFVQVFGWNGLAPAKRKKFIDELSDHSALVATLVT